MHYRIFFKFGALFCVTVALLISCKSTKSQRDVNVELGTVKATIDGDGWQANGGSATRVDLGSNQPVAVAITAVNVDQSNSEFQSITLNVFTNSEAANIGVGTYDLINIDVPANDNKEKAGQLAFSITANGESTLYISTSGMVEITSLTQNNIQGKFEGLVLNDSDGSDSKEIKDGEFNVTFSNYSFTSVFSSPEIHREAF
ncbi:MAG TPA: hypothetical protein VJ964_10015 [Balneolaceae bacterium]|nr:hypothetical protein [Balneolaceae bacterium]